MVHKTLFCCLIITVGVHICHGGSCDRDAILKCLNPVKSFLQDGNMGQSKKQLFQTAIEHYILTLGDAHDNFIHIDSLNSILKKIDEVFLHPKGLQQGCSIFTQAEQCLRDIKTWCHQETRDDLEGLENIFSYMCQEKYQKVYRANYQCLANEDLASVREGCDQKLEQNLNGISQPVPNENGTEVSGSLQQSKDTLKYDIHNGGIYVRFKSGSQAEEENYLKTTICQYVKNALLCYKTGVESRCNTSAAEWSYKLRHSLVQLLLIDLTCEEEDELFMINSLLNETTCYYCLDGSACIDLSKKCNSEKDCPDGSDEDNCDSGVKIASIFIGLAVAFIVVVLIIVCIVKCREEASFGLKRSNSSTEMMSITQQEIALGDSTPPVNGRQFIYKPVPVPGASNA